MAIMDLVNHDQDIINDWYPLKEHPKPSSLVKRLSQSDILAGNYKYLKNMIPKNAIFRRQ